MLTNQEFDILYGIIKNKSVTQRELASKIKCSVGKTNKLINELKEQDLINEDGITARGLDMMKPYKVDNAVILAAGAATRFIPLSLEQPKGLYEVKGEKLLDRQIKQLKEAGIEDITIILGYKKEMYFYLMDKFKVNFIFNSSYNIKNNIESLYLAKDKLKNTYVCCCDNYYTDNPFNSYEYRSFSSGYKVDCKENEMYAVTDKDGKITRMKVGMDKGTVLIGFAFWKEDFSKKFIEIAEADRNVGVYNDSYWEMLVKDHLIELPDYYCKEYDDHSIYEFDYFEQLKKFDESYNIDAHSRIINNIKSVFKCNDEDIVDFRNVSEGMTNISFIFKIDGVDYIYRHPGDGTENIINRKNERYSLIKAKEIGIDPTYVYMDVKEGWKISVFIHEFREPDYKNFEDSKKILKVLRQLHASDITMEYGLNPWEDAADMEKMLIEKDPTCFKQFAKLKNDIGELYRRTQGDGVDKCFCHADTYKPNWMIKKNGDVILIDWEYSGYSDPGIDVGYYIVDAMYDFDEAKKFIDEYLEHKKDDKLMFHYMAYTAIIAYYWFVWAMYRESCGAVMGESLYNWYLMAKKYSEYLLK